MHRWSVAGVGLLLALSCGGITPAALAAGATAPGRVLVCYNSNWTGDTDKDGVQDSLQAATYYAQKRGIPAANVVPLPCTNGGIGSGYYYYYTGEWNLFYSEVMQPIQNKLAAVGPTNIDVILLCYGVPYEVYVPSTSSGVSVDNLLIGINYFNAAGTNVFWSTQPYMDAAPTFSGGDAPHFDHAKYKFNGTEMYLVSRIDGPRGVAGVMDMVDQAIYGERYIAAGGGFYNGNVYVDSRYGQASGSTLLTDSYLSAQTEVQTGNYYSYYSADLNMAYAEHYVSGTGLPLKWENTTSAVSIGDPGALYATAPNALLYGGWYNFARYNDVWSWLPGSIACDLNSNSLDGRAIRDDTRATAFGCKALARGATCFCGVIDEPYLNGHPRPNILLYYVLKGYNFAEASMLCTPSIGWMPINIGDPLYAPFAPKTAVQDKQPPALATGYPTISLGAGALDRIVTILVKDTPEPDVAQVSIDYGTTPAYGTTVNSGQGFWRRMGLTLPSLLANTTYHYRVTLTDPAGNVTTSGDLTFTTSTTAPAITSTAPATGTAGSLYTYNATATGSPTPLWSLSSAPAGMNVDRASGVVTWTPAAAGSYSATLVAGNGVPSNATQTFSITIAPAPPTFALTVNSGSGSGSYVAGAVVPITANAPGSGQVFAQWTGAAVANPGAASTTLTMPAVATAVTATYAAANHPPTITSGATAAPAHATAGTAVQLVVAAADSDFDALTYTWDFGDQTGATGTSVSHTYTANGTYTATVTISDGHGHTISSSATVVVDPSGSSGGGGGTSPNALAFTVNALHGNMTSAGGHDGCSVSGVIPGLPAQFQPANATVIVNIAGASDTFSLDAKGRAHNAGGSFQLSLKLTHTKLVKKPFFAGGNATFKATLTKGSWAAVWAAAGMDVQTTAKNAPKTLTVGLTLNGQIYQIPATVVFSGKAGKGAFKKK